MTGNLWDGEPRPTADDLAEVLRDGLLNEDEITDAMRRAMVLIQERRKEAEWTRESIEFLKAYRRVQGEDANDHNIEGWHESLLEAAEGLVILGAAPDRLSEQRQRLVRAAGITYLYEMIDSTQVADDADAQGMIAHLRGAGMDPAALHTEFVTAFRQYGPEGERQRPDEDFESFATMAEFWAGASDVYDHLVTTAVQPLYDELRVSLDLPELDEAGLYPEEIH